MMQHKNGRMPSHKVTHKFSMTRFSSEFDLSKSIFTYDATQKRPNAAPQGDPEIFDDTAQ